MNNNSTLEPNNNNNNNSFDVSGFTYGVAFVVGLILTIVIVAFACVRLRLRMSRSPNMLNILAGIPPSHVGEDLVDVMEQGLPHHHHIETNFESYPKLLYSEVQKKNKDGSSIIYPSCSICLGDYKETDMLRLLPGCDHLYHLNCVDPWLRLHSTCPICRKSSVQAQQSSASNIGDSAIRDVLMI